MVSQVSFLSTAFSNSKYEPTGDDPNLCLGRKVLQIRSGFIKRISLNYFTAKHT